MSSEAAVPSDLEVSRATTPITGSGTRPPAERPTTLPSISPGQTGSNPAPPVEPPGGTRLRMSRAPPARPRTPADPEQTRSL